MELDKIQEKIKEFTKDKNLNSEVEIRLIDLISELGELSKEVLKGNQYGSQKFKKPHGWENELGDVFFSLICIANETQVDLETCLIEALNKYENRYKRNGEISSGGNK